MNTPKSKRSKRSQKSSPKTSQPSNPASSSSSTSTLSEDAETLLQLLLQSPHLIPSFFEALEVMQNEEQMKEFTAQPHPPLPKIVSSVVHTISGTPPTCLEGLHSTAGIPIPTEGPIKRTLFPHTPKGPIIVLHEEGDVVTLKHGRTNSDPRPN